MVRHLCNDTNSRVHCYGYIIEKDLRKHKNDVFRLLQIVPVGKKVKVEGIVKANISRFLDLMTMEDLGLVQMGLPFGKEKALEMLYNIYL